MNQTDIFNGIIAGIIAGCCVAILIALVRFINRKLREEKVRLKMENKSLKTEKETIEKENKHLETENEALKVENKKLRERIRLYEKLVDAYAIELKRKDEDLGLKDQENSKLKQEYEDAQNLIRAHEALRKLSQREQQILVMMFKQPQERYKQRLSNHDEA